MGEMVLRLLYDLARPIRVGWNLPICYGGICGKAKKMRCTFPALLSINLAVFLLQWPQYLSQEKLNDITSR